MVQSWDHGIMGKESSWCAVETGLLNQFQSSCETQARMDGPMDHGKLGHDKQKLDGPTTHEQRKTIPSHINLDQPVSSTLGRNFIFKACRNQHLRCGAAPKAWNPSKMTWFFGEKKGGNHKIIPTLLMEKIIGQPQVLVSPCLENRPMVSKTTSSNSEPLAGRVPNRHSFHGEIVSPCPRFVAYLPASRVWTCFLPGKVQASIRL